MVPQGPGETKGLWFPRGPGETIGLWSPKGPGETSDLWSTIGPDETSGLWSTVGPGETSGLWSYRGPGEIMVCGPPGDQVLEWNGRPLQGATFKEVYNIILESKTQPQIELLVSRAVRSVPPTLTLTLNLTLNLTLFLTLTLTLHPDITSVQTGALTLTSLTSVQTEALTLTWVCCVSSDSAQMSDNSPTHLDSGESHSHLTNCFA